jgi:hypothetical protein
MDDQPATSPLRQYLGICRKGLAMTMETCQDRRFGPSFACCLLQDSFLLGFLVNPEDAGDMFLRNG